MNSEQTDSSKQPGLLKKITAAIGLGKVEERTLEINDPPDDRGNRLCVSLSDIHLTDGTVGFQNLSNATWDAFYDAIKQRCIRYQINELVLVLDGDIVDMIRSSKWAQAKTYPWERERKAEFSAVVNDIIHDIVEQHADFFKWLRSLESKLKQDIATHTLNVKTIVLLGNHDKELFCDQSALKYFYETALGQEVSEIPEQERRMLGRMYGDETLFLDTNQAPYFPFYFGDTGFRFFTTHGQWRDANNSRQIKAQNGKPGWKAAKGWRPETWQQLKFSPFIEPCFGDTVAAGILSTFIFKVKEKFTEINYDNPRLISILNELDLYRPTYAAINRILDETANMRSKKQESKIITIIENTLYDCIIDWLSWDFTYQSSTTLRRFGLKIAKRILEIMKSVGHGLEIKTIGLLMRILTFLDKQHKPNLNLAAMKKFPSFMPGYRHYKFQIHGEGHTHFPHQEEPNIKADHPTTYINFGTWRDQIVPRKKSGYRRRSVLRALFILDIAIDNKKETGSRTVEYFVADIIHWGDSKDALDEIRHAEPRT